MIFGRKPKPTILQMVQHELEISEQNLLHHLEEQEKQTALVGMYRQRIQRLEHYVKSKSTTPSSAAPSPSIGTFKVGAPEELRVLHDRASHSNEVIAAFRTHTGLDKL